MIKAAFQLSFMAFAVNIINRHGPNNEMRRQLNPKKAKVLLAFYLTTNDILPALHF